MSHVFGVLPEGDNQVRFSCNVNISKIQFKYLKKEIWWFWKTELNGKSTKEN